MKSEDILKAIGNSESELIEKALPHKKKKKIKPVSLIAAALAVIIVISVWFYPSHKAPALSAFAVAEAEYPYMAPCPYTEENYQKFADENALNQASDEWHQSKKEKNELYSKLDNKANGFIKETVREILNGKENTVYSPISLYLALGMLAEITDGNTRKQILDLLGYENTEELREQAEIIWKLNYNADGQFSSTLASSLWLNKELDFDSTTVNTLKKRYFASTYRGEMGSEKLNNALKDWINTQTDGNLTEHTADIELDTRDALAIVSTVFFEAAWDDEFKEKDNENAVFHSVDGAEECTFMKSTDMGMYYWGENYSAVYKSFDGYSRMWFILPDEDTTVEEAVKDEELLNFILTGEESKNSKYVLTHLSVPKFDISSSLSLNESLKKLGISDVFDPTTADFSPMIKTENEYFLDKINHCARVMIDEKGCTASAFTLMNAAGAGAPDEEVDFILDRPFIFAITNVNGLPLFVGTVNYIN